MEALEFFTAVTVLFAASSLAERQFHFVNQLKTWTEAQTHCRDQFKDLVTISSQENLTALVSNVTDVEILPLDEKEDRAWIGLKSDVEGWEWSMSDPNFFQNAADSKYRNWRSGQPDNFQNPEICVQVSGDGLWEDHSCEVKQRYVCAEVNGQNVTFILSDNTKSWTDAQAECRKDNRELATARNVEENEMIKKMLPAEFVWIGLHRNSWLWVDGSKPSFTRWKSQKPDDGYVCAVTNINHNGEWENFPCDFRFPFFCYSEIIQEEEHIQDEEDLEENILVPVSRLTVKLKLQTPSSLDLNDAGVLEDLLVQFKQKLKEDKVEGDIRLSWKGRSDGTVFRKDG